MDWRTRLRFHQTRRGSRLGQRLGPPERGLFLQGRIQDANECHERALQLNSSDANARRMLQDLKSKVR